MHVIGTAGHVDHGKSALVTRLTGIDPDRFTEEKRRGLTIDLGFAWLTLPSGAEVGIVDVPGHERFVKNMLAGAGGITLCLFVVAANEGWKPQSAEHLAIVDVLQVPSGIVALTKSDTVDAETIELARLEIEERTANTSLAGAPIVACSAVTGAGLDELVRELDRVVAETPPAPDLGRPRLWVDRVFSMTGAGTVVTGTLAGGSLRTGTEVEILGPGSKRTRRARIRSIQTHKKEVEQSAPGNRVALNLVGLERTHAERGDAVVMPGSLATTASVDVWLRVVPAEIIGVAHRLTDKGAHLLHAGSAETPVRLRLAGTEELGPGETGYARIFLRDALPLQRGDRFVLRDAGRMITFGGGQILDPFPTGRRADRAFLASLHGAPDERALPLLVSKHGSLPAREAALRTGTSTAAGVVEFNDLLVSEERAGELADQLRAVLAEHHRASPLEKGLAREQARSAIGLEPGAFDALVQWIDDAVTDGALVHLRTHQVALDPAQESARVELLARLDSAGFQPPLGGELDTDPALLRALVEAGELVKIGDFFLTAETARGARSTVRAAIEERGGLTVAQIRDLLGTTRKYAVPLCEWLDQTGATVRKGDTRVAGPNP